MVFEKTPLSAQVLDAVAQYWRINATKGARLYGERSLRHTASAITSSA